MQLHQQPGIQMSPFCCEPLLGQGSSVQGHVELLCLLLGRAALGLESMGNGGAPTLLCKRGPDGTGEGRGHPAPEHCAPPAPASG